MVRSAITIQVFILSLFFCVGFFLPSKAQALCGPKCENGLASYAEGTACWGTDNLCYVCRNSTWVDAFAPLGLTQTPQQRPGREWACSSAFLPLAPPGSTVTCGTKWTHARDNYNCPSTCPNISLTDPAGGTNARCCGWTEATNTQCLATANQAQLTLAPDSCQLLGNGSVTETCIEENGTDVLCSREQKQHARQISMGQQINLNVDQLMLRSQAEALCRQNGYARVYINSRGASYCTSGNTQGCGLGDCTFPRGVCENTTALFDSLNSSIFAEQPTADLTTPRGIISRLLPYLFTFAGLILFVMIMWGGFEMLTGAANPKSQEAGKQRITNAIVGFLLLFCSYFLAQLVELILRVDIL